MSTYLNKSKTSLISYNSTNKQNKLINKSTKSQQLYCNIKNTLFLIAGINMKKVDEEEKKKIIIIIIVVVVISIFNIII